MTQQGINGTPPDPHGVEGCLMAMFIGGPIVGLALLAFVYGIAWIGEAVFGV